MENNMPLGITVVRSNWYSNVYGVFTVFVVSPFKDHETIYLVLKPFMAKLNSAGANCR